MKKIYITTDRSTFWNDYWKRISRDPDNLNLNSYPIHLIDKYISQQFRIIDIGCGLGRVVKHYNKFGVTIFGLDDNRYSIHTLKQENPSLPLIQATVINVPFRNDVFDIIMAFGVIGHLEKDIDLALSEINRILIGDGLFALSLCYDNFGRWVFQIIHKIPYVFFHKQKYFYTNLFTLDEIYQLLAINGFEIIEISPINSREIVYNYFPFFRSKIIGITEKREGNLEKSLNIWGEVFFKIISKYPYYWTYAISIVAKKMNQYKS